MKHTIAAAELPAMHINEVRALDDFPNVNDVCPHCQGSGERDVAYHGSPEWELCYCSGGRVLRPMREHEKERYLLTLIRKGGKDDEYRP